MSGRYTRSNLVGKSKLEKEAKSVGKEDQNVNGDEINKTNRDALKAKKRKMTKKNEQDSKMNEAKEVSSGKGKKRKTNKRTKATFKEGDQLMEMEVDQVEQESTFPASSDNEEINSESSEEDEDEATSENNNAMRCFDTDDEMSTERDTESEFEEDGEIIDQEDELGNSKIKVCNKSMTGKQVQQLLEDLMGQTMGKTQEKMLEMFQNTAEIWQQQLHEGQYGKKNKNVAPRQEQRRHSQERDRMDLQHLDGGRETILSTNNRYSQQMTGLIRSFEKQKQLVQRCITQVTLQRQQNE